MDITLSLGGVIISIHSPKQLLIDPELQPFQVADGNPDVRVRLTWEFDSVSLPSGPLLGEDLICCHYREGETNICLTRGGDKGPVGCAYYDDSCRDILVAVNDGPFLMPTTTLGKVMRMIPMRAVFQHFGVLFFHASQIAFCGRGILFTAPSGTGKTTQARLWKKFRGAEIVCNDRTLIRDTDGVWHTYGYPQDGSEPVRSSDSNELGAIVHLAQGSENIAERLRPGRAAAMLMEQCVMDTWNPSARNTVLTQIFNLQGEIPVYRLTCTPDEAAVETLEKILMKDKVIAYE